MKRTMFLVVLLAVLFISFSAAVTSVFANNGDNLAAAGKKVLQEKERTLLDKKAAIDVFVLKIAADGVATGEEMIALNAMVDDFTLIKKKADQYLKFYNLETTTFLDQELIRMTKSYYANNMLFKQDQGNLVKAYLTRLTGQDIVVKKSGPSVAGGEITAMAFMFILLALSVAGIILSGKHRKIGLPMFAFAFMFFLFFTTLLLLA